MGEKTLEMRQTLEVNQAFILKKVIHQFQQEK